MCLTNSPSYSSDFSHGVPVGSEGSIGGSRWTLLDDAMILGDNAVTLGGPDHDDEDEELGADEMDELVGQLVDYVSDLALA